MVYEIWSRAGGNLVRAVESEDDAWGAIRDLATRHGEAYLDRLALTREDEEGETVTLGVGRDLIRHLHATA